MSVLPAGSPEADAPLPLLAEGGPTGEGEAGGEFPVIFQALARGAGPQPEGEDGADALPTADGQKEGGGEGSGGVLLIALQVMQVMSGALPLNSEGSEKATLTEIAPEGEGTAANKGGNPLLNLPASLKEKALISEPAAGRTPGQAVPQENQSPVPAPGAESPGRAVPLGDFSGGVALPLERLSGAPSLQEKTPGAFKPGGSEGNASVSPNRAGFAPEGKGAFPLAEERAEGDEKGLPKLKALEVKAQKPLPQKEPLAPSPEGATPKSKALPGGPFPPDEKAAPEGKALPGQNLLSQHKSFSPTPELSPPPGREPTEAKAMPSPEPQVHPPFQGEELKVESKGPLPEAKDGPTSKAPLFTATSEPPLKAEGAGAKAAPSAFRAELNERIMEQVIEKATLSVNGERREVSLRLEPDSLGVVRVHLRLEEGTLSARLMAQSHAVKEALEQGFPRLKEALADQGLTLADLRVDVGDGRGSSMLSSQEGNGGAKPESDEVGPAGDLKESPAAKGAYSPLGLETGRISIFA